MMKSLTVIFLLIFVSGMSFTSAHKTVTVDQYSIEVGWRDEPPLVNQQNAIVFSITTEEGGGISSGVTNAFRDLTATVKSGSVTKTLDILSDVRTGHYYSKIIPTKVGTLTVVLHGTINGVPVNEEVTIEAVESLDIIAFPPISGAGQADVAQLKNTISSLQKDLSDLKSKVGGVDVGNVDISKLYDYTIFGLALGAAGVVLAVFAMIKRK